MTFTTDRFTNPTSTFDIVSSTLATFKRLSTDDQLGLLWVLYENMGGAITPAAPGAARLQLAAGLLERVKSMSFQEQLQVQRDLADKVETPETRAYGVLSNNNKLAFWFQLGEWMRSGEAVPVPANYKLSLDANRVFDQIARLEFNQQITILRQAVVNMGIDPLA
ncbi:MAG: orange carotenoid protein N-terminal domain-containing protein [Cyanobacteriota bacterium]|nr:orange carotenoid protein N-terminal domain-containing protein [Cyanobacteriota bacterium]